MLVLGQALLHGEDAAVELDREAVVLSMKDNTIYTILYNIKDSIYDIL